MILMSMMSMMWWRKNVIILLLSLELMLLSIFLLVVMNMSIISFMSLLTMLTIMVSGSALGLVMLVSFCRFFKSPNASPLWSLIFDKSHYPYYCYKIIF